MVDRTLLISVCLVIIAFMFFAGAFLIFTQVHNSGQSNPPDFQNSDGNMKNPSVGFIGPAQGQSGNFVHGQSGMRCSQGPEESERMIDKGPDEMKMAGEGCGKDVQKAMTEDNTNDKHFSGDEKQGDMPCHQGKPRFDTERGDFSGPDSRSNPTVVCLVLIKQ